MHINSRHLKATNICHVCAKEIRSKQSFEKHVRSHFGECGPRVKCPREDCDSWLKDDENLKQHLRRFHSMAQELHCPQCGRLCRSKHSLANHLRETHSSRTFTCAECKKAFKSAKSLKVKLTIFLMRLLCYCCFDNNYYYPPGAHGWSFRTTIV